MQWFWNFLEAESQEGKANFLFFFTPIVCVGVFLYYWHGMRAEKKKSSLNNETLHGMTEGGRRGGGDENMTQ